MFRQNDKSLRYIKQFWDSTRQESGCCSYGPQGKTRKVRGVTERKIRTLGKPPPDHFTRSNGDVLNGTLQTPVPLLV